MPRPTATPKLLKRASGAPQHARALRQQAMAQAQASRVYLLVVAPLLAGVLVLNAYRETLFGRNVPVRIAIAVVLVILGLVLARSLGRFAAPRLLSRLEPGAAGVTGFAIRLGTMVVILVVALRIAGLGPGTITLGASATAIVLGLAAQQTFGNVIAGIVLLSARPFVVGDRVRFNGFGMDVEGTVTAHGLLYVTCYDGRDAVLVPNNTALTMSVRPIREPESVEMRARLPNQTDPEGVQNALSEALTVPLQSPPRVELVELDGSEVVMRIHTSPADPADGAALAREVLQAVSTVAVADGAPDREGAAADGAPDRERAATVA